jgi:hypothetical protein
MVGRNAIAEEIRSAEPRITAALLTMTRVVSKDRRRSTAA